VATRTLPKRNSVAIRIYRPEERDRCVYDIYFTGKRQNGSVTP